MYHLFYCNVPQHCTSYIFWESIWKSKAVLVKMKWPTRGMIALERAFRTGRMGAAGEHGTSGWSWRMLVWNQEKTGQVVVLVEEWPRALPPTSGCTTWRRMVRWVYRKRTSQDLPYGKSYALYKAYLQKTGVYSLTGHSLKQKKDQWASKCV